MRNYFYILITSIGFIAFSFSYTNVNAQFSASAPWTTLAPDQFIFGGATGTCPTCTLEILGDVNLASGVALKYNGIDFIKLKNTDNILIGISAGIGLTTGGDYNLFIGNNAGKATTSGAYNSFVGNVSGAMNGTGYGNSFFGFSSGFSNVTGYNNSYFGNLANGDPGIFNAVAIGSNAYVQTSNSIVLGDYTNTNLHIGIGTPAPTYLLDVAGDIRSTTLSAGGPVFADVNGKLTLTPITNLYWNTNGNGLTTPGTHFLGTVDPIDFVIKTNNTERIRIAGGGGEMIVQYNANIGPHLGVNTPASTTDALAVGGNSLFTGNATITGNGNIQGDATVASLSNTTSTTNVVYADPSGKLMIGSAGSSTWDLTGNTGTNPLINYVGTSDLKPFVIRTDATERIRVLDDGRTNFLFNVGIDNVNPLFKLDVSAGDINIASGIYRQNGVHILSSSGSQNLFMGFGSTGLSGGTFSSCTFAGFMAGNLNNRDNNTFIGNLAGTYNTSGTENTYVGSNAGANNIGNYNVIMGHKAGYGPISGSSSNGYNNVFVGNFAGYKIEDGTDNILIGNFAGREILDGTKNTVIGKNAGYNLTGGYYNTFVGEESGMNNTTQGTISVTGVGTYVLGGAYDQLGNTFVGRWSGHHNTTGDANVFSGSFAGQENTVGIFNCFYGHRAGESNKNGSENTMIGSMAGHNGISSGTLLGCITGCDIPTFEANVFLGSSSGEFYNSVQNTYLGSGTKGRGGNNVLVGYNATAGGATPGSTPSTATWNTVSNAIAIGSHASVDAENSVALGAYSAITCTSCTTAVSNSMAIGPNAKVTSSTATPLSYAVAIGPYADVQSSYTLALGGTTASGPSLSDAGLTVIIGKTAATAWSWSTTIGGTSQVNYPSRPHNSLETDGDILIGGGLYGPSDSRFKKNIVDFTNARELIKKLHPVKFEYRDDIYYKMQGTNNDSKEKMGFTQGEQIGFIAQELQPLIPQMVRERGDGYLAVNYNHLFGVAIEGLKEMDSAMTLQNKLIDSLTKANLNLANVVSDLKSRIYTLEQVTEHSKMQGNQYGVTSGKVSGNGNVPTSINTVMSHLEQNIPNPFKENTIIGFFLTSNIQNASMLIFDMNGALLKTIPINQTGKGMLQISGGELKPGMYFYTLIADKNEVDTKKMIILE